MTPVERLRAAEARLREYVSTATPGPWWIDAANPYVYGDGQHGRTVKPAAHGETVGDAEYIALMSPPVALALADLLAAEAILLEGMKPFADLLAVAYHQTGGGLASLRFQQAGDGAQRLLGDNTTNAMRVVDALLGPEPSP